MIETLAMRVQDFLMLALFFGPPLGLVLFAHGRIRKKKKSADPRARIGLAAWRVLSFFLSIHILNVAYGLATYTPQADSIGNGLGLDMASLWIVAIFIVIPLAVMVRGVEWLEFRTRRESRNRVMDRSIVVAATSPATRGQEEE